MPFYFPFRGRVKPPHSLRLSVFLFAHAAVLILPIARALSHDGYERYRNPVTGISCCNDQDCRPMPADEVEVRLHEVKGGVTVDGVFIEDARLQEGPDGRWHICETKQRYLFCVLKPRPSF